MNNISIEIEQLGKGKNIGFAATVIENHKTTAIVMADSLKEIFQLIPETIKVNALAQEKYRKQELKKNKLKTRLLTKV